VRSSKQDHNSGGSSSSSSSNSSSGSIRAVKLKPSTEASNVGAGPASTEPSAAEAGTADTCASGTAAAAAAAAAATIAAPDVGSGARPAVSEQHHAAVKLKHTLLNLVLLSAIAPEHKSALVKLVGVADTGGTSSSIFDSQLLCAPAYADLTRRILHAITDAGVSWDVQERYLPMCVALEE
jgi:hypothetical protein